MQGDAIHRERRVAIALFLVVAAFAAYPPVYVVMTRGDRGVASYVGGDALLYLTIARNSRWGFFTFDGTMPTNGFHPLWQYFLTALIPASTAPGSMHPLWIAFTCSLIAVSIGAGLTAVAIFRYTRSPWLGLLTVPGVYYFLCGSLFSNMSIWACVSGMEAGFSTLFGGIFFYLLARATTNPERDFDRSPYQPARAPSPWLWMGLVLPFMVLSRLDDVFVVVGLLAVILILDRHRSPLRDRLVAAAQLAGPTCVAVAGYMVFNKVYAGSALPVSGKAKSGLAVVQNVYVTLAGLFPPLVDLKNAVATKKSHPQDLFGNAFRWSELVVPALIAGGYIAWFLGLRARDRQPVLSPAGGLIEGATVAEPPSPTMRYALPVGIAIGVILKAFYNIVNVNYWHQADWYYAFACLTVSFLFAIPLGPWLERLAKIPVLRRIVPAAYLIYVFMAAGRAIANNEWNAENNQEFDFIADRQQISKKLFEGHPDVRLLAFDDGLTGYTLGFPTMHGFAFAGDIESLRALREGRLLRLAYARGHKILTGPTYLALTTPLPTSDAAREFLRSSFLDDRVKSELDQFDFRLVYVTQGTDAPFFEFVPRNLATP